MRPSPLIVLATAFALGTAHLHAGGKPTPTPRPHNGRMVISMVGSTQIVTETIRSKKTYKITDKTVVYVYGQKATVSDLSKGMRVVVTPMFDGVTAATIDAGDTPQPDPTPKK